MVLFGELRKVELVVVWVTKIFLREYFTVVLHTMSLVDDLPDLTSLNVFSLALLRHDILLDSFVNLDRVGAWGVLDAVADRPPVLDCPHHVWVFRSDQIFVVLHACNWTSRVQTSLIMINKWLRRVQHLLLRLWTYTYWILRICLICVSLLFERLLYFLASVAPACLTSLAVIAVVSLLGSRSFIWKCLFSAGYRLVLVDLIG